MSDPKPAWSGEVRMAFQDTDRIVFYTHPDDEPSNLTPGRRYMAVFVEIADNESAAVAERQAKHERRRMPSNIAALLCKDISFQEYAAKIRNESGRGVFDVTEEGAIKYIYEVCGVTSRAELDINPEALAAFQEQVELPYSRDKSLGGF